MLKCQVIYETLHYISWKQFNISKEQFYIEEKIRPLLNRANVVVIEVLPYGTENPLFHKYHLKNVGIIGADNVSMTVEVFKKNHFSEGRTMIYKEPNHFGLLAPGTTHNFLIASAAYSENFLIDFNKEDLLEESEICYSQQGGPGSYIYTYMIKYHPGLNKWIGDIGNERFSEKDCPKKPSQ